MPQYSSSKTAEHRNVSFSGISALLSLGAQN
jgi:hypothetical protein